MLTTLTSALLIAVLVLTPGLPKPVDAVATIYGAVHYLNDLLDVNATTPLDNQSLTWDNASGMWVAENVTVSFNCTALDNCNFTNLGDINISAPADGWIVYWNNTAGEWQARPEDIFNCTDLSSCVLTNLGDVVITAPTNYDFLIYDTYSGNWLNQLLTSVALQIGANLGLHQLENVNATLLQGYILYWDVASSEFKMKLESTFSCSDLNSCNISELANVNATSPSANDILFWNNTAGEWQSTAESVFNCTDLASCDLDDIGDVNASAPADDDFLYWNNTDSEWQAKQVDRRFYALDDSVCIWKAWTNRVSSTPRTATIQGIAGNTITLTANVAYHFGEWGVAADPSKMNANWVQVKIADITKAPVEYAWVNATPAANQLRVTNAANIVGWNNGDIINTFGGTDPPPCLHVELNLSPLIPAGATMVFLKVQADDNGVMAWATGLQVSKEGASGTWSNVFCQVGGANSLMICGYPQCLITTDRHMMVRDRATGVNTLRHQINVIGYIK